MEIFGKNWWLIALQGLFLGVLGALAILSPDFNLGELVQFLGLVFLIFGGLLIWWGLRSRQDHQSWWGLFVIGVLQAAAGLVILWKPKEATDIFLYIIGGWAILMGLSQVIMGFGRYTNKFLFFINGAVSITFGVLIIYNPFESDKALTYLVGFYSLLLGIFIIYYAFKARSYERELKKQEKREDKAREENDEGSTP